MFKASRQVTAILRAGLPLESALSSGSPSQIMTAARGLASVAAGIGAELTDTRSNALISRTRAYQDQAADYLMECCEGIVASVDTLERSAGRDPGTYTFALQMLTSYFDLVQHATAGGGASPHAMLGGPPQGLMHDPLFDAQGAGQAHPDLGANSMMWMLEQDERVVRGRALAAQARAEKARLAGNSKPTGRGSSPTPGGYGAIRSQNRDERVVRGRALAAKARAEKARLAGNTEPTGRGSGPTSVRISHITVEATGEYDIDTYRDLIARGVSVEIVARASAKAHFIRERKRRIAEGGL